MSKQKIIDKIQKLLRLADNDGATEAEALAAAAMARKLMDEHNVTVNLEEERERKPKQQSVKSQTKRFDQINIMVSAIATYCDCRAIYDKDGVNFNFIGMPEDAMMAEEMFVMIRAVANTEWKRFIKLPEYTAALLEAHGNKNKLKRIWRKEYGMRMSQRIVALRKEREAKLETTHQGTALVVVKKEVVNNFIDKAYGRLGVRRSSGLKSGSNYARDDARAAANRTNINRRVE